MTPALLAFALASVAGCAVDSPRSREAPLFDEARAVSGAGDPARRQPGAQPDWFIDAAASGFNFVHFNGAVGEFHIPEIMGPGAGVLDYDNDGDLDVYVVQGQMLGTNEPLSRAVFPPPGPLQPAGRLYRNDLLLHADGTRSIRFTDVTEDSGIDGHGYGMGIATGDMDNDGWIDVYLTNFGRNQLFRNNGDGTFVERSRESGTDDDGWAVSASFVDYDRDGWLDLYVGNYLHYDVETATACPGRTGGRDYCAPHHGGPADTGAFRPQPDRLYRNRGDGRFDDVTATALPGQAFGAALGVVAADFNNDGWLDIYVANDGHENQLWMNRRDGAFTNAGPLSGTAVNAEGNAEASMGVDAGDFDNDGDVDLFMTHLTSQTNTVYVNDGTALFSDRSAASGLGPSSFAYTGFGAAWVDFDNDGWLDVLAVNGTVQDVGQNPGAPFPYAQRNQLFRNLANGRFEEVTERAGAVFALSEVSRGAAFGDIDNDGDMDVLVANDNGPARLLVNQIANRHHWIGLRLAGTASRDMLGARVEIVRDDGETLWRRARSDGSYASANDPRVHVGLGDEAAVRRVRVHWPDGTLEEWPRMAVDRWTTLIKGTAP